MTCNCNLNGGMALTAEQVEDVRRVMRCGGGLAFEAAHARLRALFPATEPAEDGWGDVNPNDPQGRTYRETAEEYYSVPAEPAEEETKADGLRKCRKKPVEVEAMQYDGKDWRSIAQWMAAHGAPMGRTASGLLRIHTLEGEMTAGSGDWIIRGVQGEFYPCKPDIFAQTYNPASSPVVPAPTETGPKGTAAELREFAENLIADIENREPWTASQIAEHIEENFQ